MLDGVVDIDAGACDECLTYVEQDGCRASFRSLSDMGIRDDIPKRLSSQLKCNSLLAYAFTV
jgi:hypothetical protein